MSKKRKPIGASQLKLMKDTLKSILLTINGLEGLDRHGIDKQADEVLFAYEVYLGEALGCNDQLRQFDAVFKSAGWDDQGIRLDDHYKDGVLFACLVQFTNKQRTEWTPLLGSMC